MSFLKKNIFLILLCFFSNGCTNEYIENYQESQSYVQESAHVTEALKDFQLDEIQEFQNIKLYYTPQSKDFNLISILVEKIDGATEHVYLESYIFTEKRIFDALKKAHKRGVDTRVLMEKNVYKAPYLNNTRFKELNNSGINVAWSNPENYSLNHTKMLIIDNEAIISTGNYSYSSFAYNREFFIEIGDTEFVKKMIQIYLHDFQGKKFTSYDHRLILSPDITRTKFNALIKSAKESIHIYSQTFSDDTLEEMLVKKSQAGVSVEIIFPDLKDIQSNTESYKIFTDAGISVSTMKKPKLHAKAILIDNTYLYLGSINFSYYSIEENREIGVIITNPEIITIFKQIWDNDKNL